MHNLVIFLEGISIPEWDLNPVSLESAEITPIDSQIPGSIVVILRDKPSGRAEKGLTSKD
jgi:hypothetical protein